MEDLIVVTSPLGCSAAENAAFGIFPRYAYVKITTNDRRVPLTNN